MVHGEYSASLYVVYSDDEEIYRAGNSPYDSQGYVSADSGIGLEAMRAFCRTTCRAMSAERYENMDTVRFNPDLT
jgi:hypothetical protein